MEVCNSSLSEGKGLGHLQQVVGSSLEMGIGKCKRECF